MTIDNNFMKKLISEIEKSQLFDENFYKNEYNIDSNPLEHYLHIGYKENKNPSELFDGNYYYAQYPDVKESGINPLIHYIFFGKKECRKINRDYMLNPINTRLLTKKTFEKMLEKDKYFEDRWGYYDEIITVLKELDNIRSVLEMGPYKLPLVRGEDVIDFSDNHIKHYPYEIKNFIKHDCSKFPYPIEDKTYDLVISCQVLEHLGIFGEQKKVFDELERISKKAVITLPYKWFIPDMRDHHMIDEKVIKHWANGREPSYELISGTRILQIYDFE